MKVHGIFMALFLTWTLVNSSALKSATDPPPSSHLDITSKIGDNGRRLKADKKPKKAKKTKKHKKPKKPTSVPTHVPPPLGSLLSQPHKFEYEKLSLCVPGIKMYGCADAASQEKGGDHIHKVIRGRRYIKHTGAWVAKSLCDYSDKILEGNSPDITKHKQTNNKTSQDHGTPTREEVCTLARMTGVSAMMKDPNKHFKHEAIVIENGIKYNKYVSKVYDQMTTDKEKSTLHLIQAGFVPDRVVHLEDMNGKPYVTRSYNSDDLLHETKITKFKPLTQEDKQRSTDDIMITFEKERFTRNLLSTKPYGKELLTDNKNKPSQRLAPYHQNRDLQGEFVVSIPEGCLPPISSSKSDDKDSGEDSPICLQLTENAENPGFDIAFNLNFGADSASLSAGFTTNNPPDLSLETAYGKAEGCVGVGVKGKVDLDAQLCFSGEFEYDAKTDKSAATENYQVDMSFSASAGLADVNLRLEAEGSLTMTVQNENDKAYFIGYDGLIMFTANVGVASVGLGIGVDYATPSWKQYKAPGGWATKVYAQIKWGVDLYFWSDSGTISHTFSCEPSTNKICEYAGDTNGSSLLPGYELYQGENMKPNSYMQSLDETYKLFNQANGNLVLYGPGNKMRWWSGTEGDKTKYASFQADGNFVLYKTTGDAAWASNTMNQNGFVVIVQNDGNLVMYTKTAKVVWSTNTCPDCS